MFNFAFFRGEGFYLSIPKKTAKPTNAYIIYFSVKR